MPALKLVPIKDEWQVVEYGVGTIKVLSTHATEGEAYIAIANLQSGPGQRWLSVRHDYEQAVLDA